MTYDVYHPFLCLFYIFISSLVKCLLISSTHFLVRLFVFLLLSFKLSLHILDISPISDMCFEKMFSQSVGWSFHSLNSIFHRAKVLNFTEVQLIIFSLMDFAFGGISKNLFSTKCHLDFLLCFLQVLWFYFLNIYGGIINI